MTRVANADSYQVGSGHLAAIYQTTVTLTDAQIKALPTTQITAVAAPGAGLVIQPLFVNLFLKAAAGAYTNIDVAGMLTLANVVVPTLFPLSYVANDVAITTGSATRLTDLLGAAANHRVELTPFFDTEGVNGWGPLGPVQLSTVGVNDALKVWVDNGGSGNFTGGNAANTLTVVVIYTLVTVP